MQPDEKITPAPTSVNDSENLSATAAMERLSTPALVTRSVFGGVLMGLANLVPGISGGTMLLTAGIYPRFIDAIAELTRFKFRFRSLLTLGCIVAAAGLAILLLAGMLKDLVVDHRWIMYSLFIGLTLGGVPIVWRLAKPGSAILKVSAVLAFLLMTAIALLQFNGYVGNADSSFSMMMVAGLAGASAMILPGLSGGYLLLLLGQYVPILAGVDQFKEALKSRDMTAIMEPMMSVVLPVGLGVVIGVVVVGNLLQWLLKRHKQMTLGILLGLLIGSTVGLWPFQRCIEPTVGDVVKGQALTAETLKELDPEDWPTQIFTPSVTTAASSFGLIALGFGITMAIAALGRDEGSESS
jgi:putative membrane protein